MTDRELLELAARAAGIEYNDRYGKGLWVGEFYSGKEWNPLTDDGDALRLAVNLDLLSEIDKWIDIQIREHKYFPDAITATRRAIVRAAAEIGKDLK